MSKCNHCGKKGLFFKVNFHGRCIECERIFNLQEEEKLLQANIGKIREEEKQLQDTIQKEQTPSLPILVRQKYKKE